MSSPVFTTQHGAGPQRRNIAYRPNWESVNATSGSNTAFAGAAVVPSRSTVSARRRIAVFRERTFESQGRWRRWRRRGRMVLHSPGVVLVSGVSAMLFIGLSPLLAADTGTDGQPASVVVGSVRQPATPEVPGE